MDCPLDVDDIVQSINENTRFSRVALQLPDELLEYATILTSQLERRTGRAIFVLGDTSFGSCCVDEVAAEHISADVIVHCGRCCLSSAPRIPVLYALPRELLDVDALVTAAESCPDVKGKRIMLALDVPFIHLIDSVTAAFSARDLDVICLRPLFPPSAVGNGLGPSQSAVVLPGSGRWHDRGATDSDSVLLFVGLSGPAFVRAALEFARGLAFHYDPREPGIVPAATNRLLAKRYAFVAKVKEAQNVGIIIASLSLGSMRALVAHLKSAIETAGKRAYEFIVGKINVPKLANFPEIDAFVLVGCPETTIIDSKDHLRPIVTPYEALLALGPEENEWTGNYVLDADELLGLPVAQIDANETETPGVADGTVVASSAAVARVFDGASNHLLSRTFQGLEIMERGAPSRIQQGQRGIASSYVY